MSNIKICDLGILDTEWAELVELDATIIFEQFANYFGSTKAYHLAILCVGQKSIILKEISEARLGVYELLSSHAGRCYLEQRLIGDMNRVQFQEALRLLKAIWNQNYNSVSLITILLDLGSLIAEQLVSLSLALISVGSERDFLFISSLKLYHRES